MTDGEEVRLELLSARAPKAWVCLRGTVLCYRERRWAGEMFVDIPVELISVSEDRLFRGSHLIAALSWLAFAPAAGLLLFGLLQWLAGTWDRDTGPANWIDAVSVVFPAIGFGVGVIGFIYRLRRFFVRRDSASLHVAADNWTRECWLDSDPADGARAVVHEALRRQSMVSDVMRHTTSVPLHTSFSWPGKDAAQLTLLCLLVTRWFGEPWLQLVGLAPALWWAYRVVVEPHYNRVYRRATRHALKREWAQARSVVAAQLESDANDVRLHLLMVELLMLEEDFGAAAASLSRIQQELDPEMLQTLQQEIINRQRMAARKQRAIPWEDPPLA